MKILTCQQGSSEWLAARCGRPTASRMGAIVTPTGQPVKGQARRTYMLELLAERLTGRTTDRPVTAAMQRGTELEPLARAYYELDSGRTVTQVGFILGPRGRWGCSPDGITETGGIEIKCLGNTAHLAAILERQVPADYVVQVQACMWVTGRTTWDFVAYTDARGIPSAWWTVQTDPVVQKALAECVPAFCRELDALESKVKEVA